MKNPSSSFRARGGFAIVLALVTLTLGFAIAAGLTQMRRWAHLNANKELLQAVAQATLENRALMVPRDIRTLLAASNPSFSSLATVTQDTFLSGNLATNFCWDGVTGSIPGANDISIDGGTQIGGAEEPLYYAVLDSPLDNASHVIDLPPWLSGSISSAAASYGPYDPFGTVTSLATTQTFVLRRENTQRPAIHAWEALDVITRVSVLSRVFPVTAFTIFAPTSGTAAVNFILGEQLQEDPTAGTGRIFTEGVITLGGPRNVVYPLSASDVVTGGYAFVVDGTRWPTGENSPVSDFNRMRFTSLKGRLNLGNDAVPCPLRGAPALNNNPADPSNIVAQLKSACAVSATFQSGTSGLSTGTLYFTRSASVSDEDIASIQGSIKASYTPDASGGYITINVDGEGIPKAIPSIYIETGDPVRGRIWLKGIGSRPITIVSPDPLIIQDSYNYFETIDGVTSRILLPPASALVSPKIFTVASAPSQSVNINAAIVTTASNPFSALRSSAEYGLAPGQNNLIGSLAIWGYDASASGAPTTIIPDPAMITGIRQPPLVPAVVDIWPAVQTLQSHRIQAQ